ncbi:MAG: molybdopterin-guanine dinucleotide biosynthesis protein MobB [Thermoplasmata archaeon]|nr:molybdopterin-guanine dinucleotide biosynthesis protein MobB [Thermoplasmata archaeon]
MTAKKGPAGIETGGKEGSVLVFSVCGPSGSGKTTLIEQLLKHLAGYRICVVKDAPRHGDIEKAPGGDGKAKDTLRYRLSGASVAALSTGETGVLTFNRRLDVDEWLSVLQSLGPWDLILMEGFKSSPVPKIAVGKIAAGGREAGVACENVVLFHDNVEETAEFLRVQIETWKKHRMLDDTNCGRCGRTCGRTAIYLRKGGEARPPCIKESGGGIDAAPDSGVAGETDGDFVGLWINDTPIELGNYPRRVLRAVVNSLVSTLKFRPPEGSSSTGRRGEKIVVVVPWDMPRDEASSGYGGEK